MIERNGRMNRKEQAYLLSDSSSNEEELLAKACKAITCLQRL